VEQSRGVHVIVLSSFFFPTSVIPRPVHTCCEHFLSTLGTHFASDQTRAKKNKIEDREELKQRSPDCGIFKTDCILTFAL
jgi:hypothetical protein